MPISYFAQKFYSRKYSTGKELITLPKALIIVSLPVNLNLNRIKLFLNTQKIYWLKLKGVLSNLVFLTENMRELI